MIYKIVDNLSDSFPVSKAEIRKSVRKSAIFLPVNALLKCMGDEMNRGIPCYHSETPVGMVGGETFFNIFETNKIPCTDS